LIHRKRSETEVCFSEYISVLGFLFTMPPTTT
jgi:hypothetical protein